MTIESKKNELNAYILKAYEDNDINNVRKTLEAICKIIILNEFGESEGLKIILDKSDAKIRGYSLESAIESIIFNNNSTPALVNNNKIRNNFKFIQAQSNVGSHDDYVKLNSSDKLIIFIHLNTVLEWFYSQYLGEEIDSLIQVSIKNIHKNFEIHNIKDNNLKKEWEEIVSETDNFNKNLNKYFLITDEINEHPFLENLFNIFWTYIADFNTKSDSEGFYCLSNKFLESKRNINLLIRGNELEYSKSNLYWDFVNGTMTYPETLSNNHRAWNQRYIVTGMIQKHLQNLKDNLEQSDVFIFINWNDKIKTSYLIDFMSSMDFYFPNAKIILLSENIKTIQNIEMEFKEFSNLTNIKYLNCSIANFSLLLFNYNQIQTSSTINIASSVVGSEITLHQIDNIEYIKYKDDIKLFPVNFNNEPLDCNDYYKGDLINFSYLDQDCLISRQKESNVLYDINKLLETTKVNKIYYLLSEAGAGSTSLGYKLLWNLKEKYPCLHLMNYKKKYTYLFLQYLYTTTKTPLVIFIDINLNDENIKTLTTELENQQIKFLFIRVIRFLTEKETKQYINGYRHHYHLLIDSLDANESKNLYNKLISLNLSRKESLLNVKNSPKPSLFKYLFSTFRDEYKNIDIYIKNKLLSLSPFQKNRLKHLSLIQYFTGINVSIYFLTKSNNKYSLFDKNSTIEPLIHYSDEYEIKIIHNLVAKKILTFLTGLTDENLLHQKIKELSLSLLDFIDTEFPSDKNNKNILEIINSLFIRRKIKLYDTDSTNNMNRHYTELLDKTSIDDREEIFIKLINIYPENSHFLAHFGRFYSVDRKNITFALDYIDKAISISEKENTEGQHDSILYHIKGMVYFREILQRKEINNIELDEIIKLAKEALHYFNLSLEYDTQSNNDYPYISSAKLILTVLRVGKEKYGTLDGFLNEHKNDSFVESLIDNINEIISEFKELNNNDEDITFFDMESIENQLFELYENYSSALSSLYNNLSTNNFNNHIIKRTIVRLTIKKFNNDVNNIEVKKVNNLISFLEENLNNVDNDVSSSDLLLFLRLIRHNNCNYDLLKTLEILKKLKETYTEDNLNGRFRKNLRLQILFYYLIVRFLQLINGNNNVIDEINELKDEISGSSMNIRGGKTLAREWLSNGSNNFKRVIYRYDNRLEWDDDSSFFKKESYNKYLFKVEGTIKRINGQTRGYINYLGIDIFFVPKAKFSNNDLNKKVSFFLSFGFDEIRAWNVEFI